MLNSKKYVSVHLDESGLKERNKELSILVELSNFLSISMGLEDLLEGALTRVLEYLGLEAGRIYLMDNGGEYLNLAAYRGLEPDGLEKVRIDEGFSGQAVRTMSFIGQHVSELKDKKRAALLLEKGLKGVMCVPLIVRDQVVGVLNLATSKMIELNQGKIDILTAIGNQIAVAVNNAQLYDELGTKIDTLKEKKEMIKFFAYSASHDLKSPATAIYGLIKLLKEKYGGVLDQKGREYCDHILKASGEMVELVEEINAYIRTREASLNIEKVNVKEVTDEIRNEFSTTLQQRQISWSEPEAIPEVMADRLAISRVFRNLLDNALKYGGEEMFNIKIGYEENDAYHIFSFSDDGVGIKTGEREKIFEMFQRSETSQGTFGSGLGLAIVKEVAQRHGGQALMDSEAGGGTAFYISISKDIKSTD